MTEYSFQEEIPEGFTLDFEAGIFHDQRHLQLQSLSGWRSFVLLNNKKRTIVALVHYHLEGVIAKSPLRSPYGSFIFSKTISDDLLNEFVAFTEMRLKEKGVEVLLLKNPPEVYAPLESELLQRVLLQAAYDVQVEELSAVIPVTERKFESILHVSEKKRLCKCKESGSSFQQVPLENLSSLYSFLKTCREEKGYTLSMSLSELQLVTSVFHNSFFLSTVTIDNQLAAANISIQVNDHVLYNFYHDHKGSFDSLSPVVFLNEGLYQVCQQKKLKLLDLGTSNADGVLNESLLNFKLRLGAQPSRKLTFVKKLA